MDLALPLLPPSEERSESPKQERERTAPSYKIEALLKRARRTLHSKREMFGKKRSYPKRATMKAR